MTTFSLADLERIVAAREADTTAASYTKSLLTQGVARTAKKFGEEAVECAIAAVAQDQTALVAESADVLYHLMVMLRSRGVTLDAVMAELARRTAQSGHEEKASRAAKPGG